MLSPTLQPQHAEKKAQQNHLQTNSQASERGNNQTQSFRRVERTESRFAPDS